MIEERAASAKFETRLQSQSYKLLRSANRALEVASAREMSRDGGRKCASGSVGVAIDTRRLHRNEAAPII